MCGILGYLDKRSPNARIGQTMLAMMRALSCRGPDSVGVAFYGPPAETWTVVIPLETIPPPEAVIEALQPIDSSVIGAYLTLCVAAEPDAGEYERHLLARFPAAEVVSLGHAVEVIKEVGSPDNLEAKYGISMVEGSHGIGHTRLSTESKVDLSHSQPFWAHGVPDLTTVHNGHVTNYHKLRRQYEQRGVKFYTENDSEVIGVYLRDRMSKGLSFEDSLRSALDDLDGSFCILAATAEKFAFVRDRFGFKPLVMAETDDFVAVATEEMALRKALGRDFTAAEPTPGKLRVWDVKSLTPAGS